MKTEKLDGKQCRKVAELYHAGYEPGDIARRFGIQVSRVRAITIQYSKFVQKGERA